MTHDDYEPAGGAGGAKLGLAAFGIAVALFAAAGLVLAIAGGGAGGGRPPAPPGRARPAAAAPASTVTRDRFTELVMGRTKEEVVAAVGRPDETSGNSDPGSGVWTYKGRTHDPASRGGADRYAFLHFADGVVVRVGY